jgi:hypothetical protein
MHDPHNSRAGPVYWSLLMTKLSRGWYSSSQTNSDPFVRFNKTPGSEKHDQLEPNEATSQSVDHVHAERLLND